MKRFLLALASAALVCLPAFSVAEAAPQSIKIVCPMGSRDFNNVLLRDVFKPYVEKNSNGKYQVDIFTDSSMGGVQEIFQGVTFGTVHFAQAGGGLSTYMPEMGVLDMPFLANSRENAVTFCATDGFAFVDKALQKKGMKLMLLYPNGFREFQSTRPIPSYASLKGLKCRTSQSKYHVAMAEAFGMVGTSIVGSEGTAALQQGVVQVIDGDLLSALAFGVLAVSPNIYASKHQMMPGLIYCNKKWFDSLSAEDQKLFQGAFAEFNKAFLEGYGAVYDEVLARIVPEFHGTITQPTDAERLQMAEDAAKAYDSLPADLKKIALEFHEKYGAR